MCWPAVMHGSIHQQSISVHVGVCACDAGGRECGLCSHLIYRSGPFRLGGGAAPSLMLGPPPIEMDVYFREDAGIIVVEVPGKWLWVIWVIFLLLSHCSPAGRVSGG